MDTRKLMARPLSGAVALVLGACLAGNALAQEHPGTSARTMKVRYSDLNISTTAGATTLYRRIVGAAQQVCGEEGYEIGIDAERAWHDCFDSAVNDAVEKVHSPLLKAVQHRSTAAAPVTAMLRH
jgi:UrcA family protein